MRCREGRRFVMAAGICTAVAAGSGAHAQAPTSSGPTSNDNVAAEALFEEGRAMVAAGKYPEACSKFTDSERLGPSVATLLNLANCWEKAGRLASAWVTYRSAASEAYATGRKDYLVTAQRRAEGLAPRLARLTVAVPQSAPGLQVKRDGSAVDSAEWGVAIPVDAGAHTVDATAPGRKPWSITVDVAEDGVRASVAVPVLQEAPAEEASTGGSSPAANAPSATPGTSEPGPASGGGGKQRIMGAIVAGAGVVGLAVGAVFALDAKSKYDDSLKGCEPANPNLCGPTGLSQRDDARSAGNTSTAFVGVGAAAVVAGGILWWLAPSSRATAFAVSPTPGGVVARGAW